MAASFLTIGGLTLDQIVADADETLTRLLVQRPNRYEQKQVEVRSFGLRSGVIPTHANQRDAQMSPEKTGPQAAEIKGSRAARGHDDQLKALP